jgi:hypothetical protein
MTTASVFTGVKLGNESILELQDLARQTFGKLLPRTRGQHITIRFRGSPDKIPTDIMGRMVEFRVVGFLWTEGVQVAQVEPLGDAKELEYAHIPHVTLSLDDGVKPSTAKSVLKTHRANVQKTKTKLILKGQVGFIHDRHGWVFSHLPEEEMVPEFERA